MPVKANLLPAERSGRITAGSTATPPKPRLAESTGAIRVLQNRQAPAQRSLFDQALPAR